MYTYTYGYMATKTITIREDVYDKLKALQRADESFSDQLDRITETDDILELAGAWSDLDDEEIEAMHARRREARRSTRATL